MDPLPSYVMKQCVSTLLPVITSIVNRSLDTASMPESLKIAQIDPHLKKFGLDHEMFKNFRPVSNLAFVSKVIEKAVAAQLIEYIDSNDLGELYQSAYKKMHSTETALLKMQNDILRAIDQHKTVALLLLDLSAAFDTVDHAILLHRLQSRFGISEKALYWFRSYLDNRWQYVSLRGTKSSCHRTCYGVPQGSVLGPILYLIYTSPLGDIVRRHGMSFHCYADDTQIYFAFESDTPAAVTSERIEACIKDVSDWMSTNMLIFNMDKIELVLIGSQYRPKLCLRPIHMGGKLIQPYI